MGGESGSNKRDNFFTLWSPKELAPSLCSDPKEYGFPLFGRRLKKFQEAPTGHLVEGTPPQRISHHQLEKIKEDEGLGVDVVVQTHELGSSDKRPTVGMEL